MSSPGLPSIAVNAAGAQPTPPAVLLAKLLALVAATNPGYTANLPGSLVEDISSTDVGALVTIDQAAVDYINSLSPYKANPALLIELGNLYGVPQGLGSNTSVYAVFTGTVGFVIPKGFTITDGTYQYVVQDGGIVASSGNSSPLFCLASASGSWAVPPNTVTTLVTSIPATVTLSVTNPLAGTQGLGVQSEEDYRAQVLQAGRAASQGMASYLKTLLGNVSGVQPRLVSPLQAEGGGWEIIVGGGDPYEVAYAIYIALFDVSTLTGSVLSVAGITNAFPGVVTTVLNHGCSTGQVVQINGATGMLAINGVNLTVAVITEKTFSVGVDTSAYPAYTGGGVLTPNSRNVTVSINDYPNTYAVPFVLPPQQTVTMAITWNTSSPNIVSDAAVAQAAAPAIASYVNAITVGQPMNEIEMQTVFQAAVSSIITPNLLTRLVFSVSINGVGTPPISGTGIIAGDPESYFQTAPDGSQIVVSRG